MGLKCFLDNLYYKPFIGLSVYIKCDRTSKTMDRIGRP